MCQTFLAITLMMLTEAGSHQLFPVVWQGQDAFGLVQEAFTALWQARRCHLYLTTLWNEFILSRGHLPLSSKEWELSDRIRRRKDTELKTGAGFRKLRGSLNLRKHSLSQNKNLPFRPWNLRLVIRTWALSNQPGFLQLWWGIQCNSSWEQVVSVQFRLGHGKLLYSSHIPTPHAKNFRGKTKWSVQQTDRATP